MPHGAGPIGGVPVGEGGGGEVDSRRRRPEVRIGGVGGEIGGGEGREAGPVGVGGLKTREDAMCIFSVLKWDF